MRDVGRLAAEIRDARLSVRANCAARTVIADITPIVDVVQRTGVAIEACTFIGSSPIRQYTEDWTLDRLQRLTEEAVSFAVKQGLTVMYVTEDTTRADPDSLRALYSTAIRAGAKRVCIADTVGHATPVGAAAAGAACSAVTVAPDHTTALASVASATTKYFFISKSPKTLRRRLRHCGARALGAIQGFHGRRSIRSAL